MTDFAKPESVLIVTLAAMTILLILIVLTTFITVVYTNIVQRRERRLLDAAKAEVAGFLAPGKETPRTGRIRALPLPLQIQLFRELVPLFTRDEIRKIKQLLNTGELVLYARELARSRFWWRRLHGLRVLTMLGEPVPPDGSWFRDPHLEVRAQAAEWVAASGQMDALPLLTSMLADEAGLCRFTVQDSLQRLGKSSEESLAQYILSKRGRDVEGGLEIAATFSSASVATAVLEHRSDPSPRLRRLVAIALGSFAGDRVAEALANLLNDEDTAVRAAAARSAGKLRLWTQCKRLSQLLADPDWNVRKEAALALLAVGAPGLMTLKSALQSEDRFVRETAEQALQISAIQESA